MKWNVSITNASVFVAFYEARWDHSSYPGLSLQPTQISLAASHRVNVQHVDVEVVGREVHLREHVPQRHLFALLVDADDLLAVGLHHLLDEAQQVLLVHAARRVDVGVDLAGEGGRLLGSICLRLSQLWVHGKDVCCSA